MAQAAGSARIAITANVQSHGCGSTVHPNSSTSVNAAGTRLRRRLSNSFHHDNADSGLRTRGPSGPGTSGSSQPASCQSPRIQRWRRAMSAR